MINASNQLLRAIAAADAASAAVATAMATVRDITRQHHARVTLVTPVGSRRRRQRSTVIRHRLAPRCTSTV